MEIEDIQRHSERIAEWGHRQGLIPRPQNLELVAYIFERIVKNPEARIIPRYICIDFIRFKCGRSTDPSHVPKNFKEIPFGRKVEIFTENPEPKLTTEISNKLFCERILCTINEKDRAILELIFFFDYTQREVADILEVTESAVSLRVENIFQKIRKVFRSVDQTDFHV